jgi:ADP-ribosyl-[dinitrogen reductase] hydrolase
MTNNKERELVDKGRFAPIYEGIEYFPRAHPTVGHFDELHPHQSNVDLVRTYNKLIHGEEYVPFDGSSKRLSIQANQIRRTWAVEALASGTINREVNDEELTLPEDRSIGVILGLICGDALGRPVEFMSPAQIMGTYGEVTNMIGEGSHGQPAGTVTDDSELALRLAHNIITNGGFSPDDYADQLVEWYNSDPFDVGITTLTSIQNLINGDEPDEAGYNTLDAMGPGRAAGNGSVMRCAPLAIAYPDDLDRLQKLSREMSEITHADPRCTHGCAALNIILAKLIREGSKTPIDDAITHLPDDAPDELIDRLEGVKTVRRDKLKRSGYVLDTLETALYYGLYTEKPETAIVQAVNHGGDADTIAAIAGAVAGAKHGSKQVSRKYPNAVDYWENQFPEKWTDELIMPDITGFVSAKSDSVRETNQIVLELLERGQIASALN